MTLGGGLEMALEAVGRSAVAIGMVGHIGRRHQQLRFLGQLEGIRVMDEYALDRLDAPEERVGLSRLGDI